MITDRHTIENLEYSFKQLIVYCTQFGCSRILTLEEKLCGNKCREHGKKVEVDISKHLSY